MNTSTISAPDADPHTTTPWHRLHPLSPVVRSARHVVTIIVIVLVGLMQTHQHHADHRVDFIIVGIAIIAYVISWLVTRWRLVDGVLHVESGLLSRKSSRYPLNRVQAIDIAQSGVARVLGLAELHLRMAGSGGNNGRLACLTLTHATQLRDELLAIGRAERAGMDAANIEAAAEGSSNATPGPASGLIDSTPLVTTDPMRLILGTLSCGMGLAALIIGLALIVCASVFPHAAAAIVAGGIWPFFGFIMALYKRFNGDYKLTIHATRDGFHLHSGLVQITSETLNRERIQLIRLQQPLLWRAFGWCRVEVELAGGKVKKENRGEGRILRPLLAVGPLDTGRAVLAAVAPGAPECTHPAPRRALWKAPLSWRLLAIGSNARYAVSRRGRLGVTTTWVPLVKVQSVRASEGPLQRLLGLTTLHLDVAGSRGRATLHDRDTSEALQLLHALPKLCAQCRRTST